MWFLMIGVALMLLKYLGWSALEAWPWWWVLSPFGLAVVWWAWADSSGYTKRKEVQRQEERHSERLKKLKENLNMGANDPRRKRR